MISYTVSFLLSTCLLFGFMEAAPACVHWFAIPVLACGTLIGADAIDWIRGRMDVLDPVGIVGLLGYHFFFLAPLLHVLWDEWMGYIVAPPDWRPWLGGMAFLNATGLVLYRLFRGVRPRELREPSAQWSINRKRFSVILFLALLVTGGLQLWVYYHFGGISGYIDAYMQGERHYGSKDAELVPFSNMGWIFMISESFPVLAMIGFAVLSRRRRWARSWPALLAVLFAVLVLQMLFGGLRGSRSNTVWGLFWAVGIIHLWIRAVPRSLIYAGICCFLVFMYLYGFYKNAGTDALSAVGDTEAREQLERTTHRTWHGTVLGDLGRSDVQAFALYRLWTGHEGYEYALGQTYLGAASLLIPRSLWPGRPETKERWTTELETGIGTYSPGVWVSSRVYGIAGEAMLNFGVLAIPLTFVVIALIVRRVRRFVYRLPGGDSRLLLAPLLILFCFLAIVNDSDVNVFFLIKYGAIPTLVVAAASGKRRLGNLAAREGTGLRRSVAA